MAVDQSRILHRPIGRRKPAPVTMPHVNSMMRSTYRPGDGETRTAQRPGSNDFLRCASRGVRC
jgi:hypothetical protein